MTKKDNLQFRENVLKQIFYDGVGYELNLENPKTFNEKLQWLKLYNNEPIMTKLADKYEARKYIKEKIGEKYLIELLGAWDNVDDIDFDSLPDQFVLKVNWGSGQNIIVKDKSKLNIEEAKEKLRNWMKFYNNHYYFTYEWGYKYIHPKIVCEKYMKDLNTDNLIVYGIYCYDGEPHFIHAITDAHTGYDRCNIYDTNWNKQDVVYIWENTDYEIEKPKKLNEMLDLARKLSKGLVHIRVDFFIINDDIYSSELTLYTNAGITEFKPVSWDEKFGANLKLPSEKKIEYDVVDRETLLNQVYNLEFLVSEIKKLEYYNKILEEKNKNIDLKGFTLFGIYSSKKYIKIIIFGLQITIKK